jgi:hypothetical protein
MICINCDTELFVKDKQIHCKCNFTTMLFKGDYFYFLYNYSLGLEIYKLDAKSNVYKYFYIIDADDISIINLEKFFNNLIFM